MLAEWAPIYKAMAMRGIGQAAVDEMELWVVAEILGVNDSDDRLLTEAEQRRRDAQMNAARVRAAEMGEPPPDFAATGPVLSEAQAEAALAGLRAARAARERSGV